MTISAANLMTEDIRRLLAYQEVVPRHVLLGYIRIILGIHLGLYFLRLLHLLPGWVKARQAGGRRDQGLRIGFARLKMERARV